jgi:DNA-binding GntR family transcriptional regulator
VRPRRLRVAENRNDGVYRLLKNAILRQRLALGSKLDEVKVAEQLGVSRTPVREALQRLSAEGLIELIPHRGAWVIQLTRKDVEELYEMREALEGQAARLAAARATLATVVKLDGIISAYRRAVLENQRARIMLLDAQFHETVARASKNRRLMVAIGSLRDQLRILRIRSVAIEGRPQRSLEEMGALLVAIRSREPELAESCMRAHIRSVRDDVLKQLGSGAEERAAEADVSRVRRRA